ncbi:MAG: cupin domain-containing protein [Bacteroidota bacterium]
MKKHLLLILLALLNFPLLGFAQVDTLRPVRIDKSTLSGIGLQQVELSHEPGRAFFQRRIYRGEDISVYVVSSQTWETEMNDFGIDELVFMYNGTAKVTPNGEQPVHFKTGEFFFIPKGYTGKWAIEAGDNYHYELSVITTERADSTKKSSSLLPRLLDKTKLSGVDLDLEEKGVYHELLESGIEMDIYLQGEQPRELQMTDHRQEQLIALLAGQVTMTDLDGQQHIFYTGDYFILPKGYSGTWKSEGHGLVKTLIVQKTS